MKKNSKGNQRRGIEELTFRISKIFKMAQIEKSIFHKEISSSLVLFHCMKDYFRVRFQVTKLFNISRRDYIIHQR